MVWHQKFGKENFSQTIATNHTASTQIGPMDSRLKLLSYETNKSLSGENHKLCRRSDTQLETVPDTTSEV
jgi:hypothetical protein